MRNMNKPYIDTPSGKGAFQKLVLGGGIDTSKTSFAIDTSSASYLRNMSARNFPALSSREGRKDEYGFTIASKRGIGARENDTLLLVDGDVWKYDKNGTLTTIQTFNTTGKTNRCEFAQFDAGGTLYSIVTDGVNRYAWNGTSVTNLSSITQTGSTLVTSFNGRVFWAKGRTLYASALNKIDDYTTLENLDTDSWSGTISQTIDDISAIYNYGGHIQLFTPNALFELYGTRPSTYEVIPIYAGVGCVSQWALTEAGGYLYFLDTTGIYRYNGARYTKISAPVDAYIAGINSTYKSECTLAADEKYLYAAIPYGSSVTANNLLLRYDFEKGLWFVDTGTFVDLTQFPKKALGLDVDGKIWTMQHGTADTPKTGAATAVSWDWISKAFTDEQAKSKLTVDQIWVVINLPEGSSAKLAHSTAHTGLTDFTDLYTFTANAKVQNVCVNVSSINDVDWFRLRLYGTGPVDIHYIDVHLRGQKS
jgi:hypothetical protein